MEKRLISLALLVFIVGFVMGNLGSMQTTGLVHTEGAKVNIIKILAPGSTVPASSNFVDIVAYIKLCLASVDCDSAYNYKQSYMFQPLELYIDNVPKGQMFLKQNKPNIHSVVEYWYSRPIDLKYLPKGTHTIKVIGYTTLTPLGQVSYPKTYIAESTFGVA